MPKGSLLLALLLLLGVEPVAWADADSDFLARCRAPGVVKCVGFDSTAEITGRTDYVADPAPFGLLDDGLVAPQIDRTQRASGTGSLLFTIPSNSGSSDGAYWTNFSDDLSVQFGVGEDFYVQWRQRFSADFLNTTFYEDYANRVPAGGWKQVIIGEGDRPGTNIYSCTDLEIVVNDGNQRGFPQMYHSCGAKDGQYEGLQEPFGGFDFYLQNAIRNPPCAYHSPNVPPCQGYGADEWMTFQVHVHVGTPYTNNGVYRHDSVIQLWVGHEGQPSQLVIDYSPQDPACQAQQQSQPACQTGYDLYNDQPDLRKYGQIWLLPYHTRKDAAQPHPTGYTWYDELVISRQRIADPNEAPPPVTDGGVPPGPDSGPIAIDASPSVDGAPPSLDATGPTPDAATPAGDATLAADAVLAADATAPGRDASSSSEDASAEVGRDAGPGGDDATAATALDDGKIKGSCGCANVDRPSGKAGDRLGPWLALALLLFGGRRGRPRPAPHSLL